MEKSILVLYASRKGTTVEIAKCLADEITSCGKQVVIKNVSEPTDLSNCAMVIIGSSVYAGRWNKKASNFIQMNQSILQKIPVALFCVGLSMQEESKQADAEQVLHKERSMIHPVAEGYFKGVLDYQKLNFFERALCKLMKAPEGDFRNWDHIRQWAKDLCTKVN